MLVQVLSLYEQNLNSAWNADTTSWHSKLKTNFTSFEGKKDVHIFRK